ncbi:MAG TPA: hotdog fold thioesterase [Puia sp.]|nr:hotdog fold thioesterase [Puia sp.]
MPIWFDKSLSVDHLQSFAKDTMNDFIGIKFTEVGENFLRAKMPVDPRTRQAYGILHGGASVTLAETVGSVASAMVIDSSQYYCVGVEINANHIKSIREGFVTATAIPLHLGTSTHVWDIKITDERERLICVSRLTVYIIKR